MSIHLNKY